MFGPSALRSIARSARPSTISRFAAAPRIGAAMRAYSDKPAEEAKEGAAPAAGKEEGADAEKIKGLEDKIKSLEVSYLGMRPQ